MIKIYGVDTDAEINPLKVRDAITECFAQAHCADVGLSANDDEGKKYCVMVVRKAFIDTGGDFENPTKESLLKVIDGLAEFAKKFRDQETIKKHYGEIMSLIERMN